MSGENCIMEEVFAKIKNGDQGAFEQVFRMFYMPLCDYAVMILGDQAEAEDVVQDLFTYLWKSRQEVRVQESVKSYLFTSVRFRALNVLKHKM
ncbi:MAG: sigma factor, partial [Butyricimonas faecihominis]